MFLKSSESHCLFQRQTTKSAKPAELPAEARPRKVSSLPWLIYSKRNGKQFPQWPCSNWEIFLQSSCTCLGQRMQLSLVLTARPCQHREVFMAPLWDTNRDMHWFHFPNTAFLVFHSTNKLPVEYHWPKIFCLSFAFGRGGSSGTLLTLLATLDFGFFGVDQMPFFFFKVFISVPIFLNSCVHIPLIY
jgi:hypothetical protein